LPAIETNFSCAKTQTLATLSTNAIKGFWNHIQFFIPKESDKVDEVFSNPDLRSVKSGF
jgi:hypothetical protein